MEDRSIKESISGFQDKEIDRWINENFSEGMLEKLTLGKMPGCIHETICGLVKEGIKAGISHYLGENGREDKPIYPTSIEDIGQSMLLLYNLMIDDTLEYSVSAELKVSNTGLDEQSIRRISGFVCEGYRTFTYNNSLPRFRKSFRLPMADEPGQIRDSVTSARP